MENVFTIVNDDSDNTLSNVITDYQAAEQFETDKWGDMVREADKGVNYSEDDNAGQWKAIYTEAEQVQVERRIRNGEVIKHFSKDELKADDTLVSMLNGKGGIIASKTFPKTWNTDKAIIGRALDAGIDLLDADGNPVAKTALQTEYKEAAADQDDKPVMEKLQTVANTWNALFGQLTTEDERDFARKLCSL